MESPKVSFIALNKSAILPKTHSMGAAGYDLISVCDGTVPPFTTISLKLGFVLKIPSNLFGYICGRSGIAKNNGVTIVNSYIKDDEEVTINMKNLTDVPFSFEKGARIAQLFFAVVDDSKIEEVDKV